MYRAIDSAYCPENDEMFCISEKTDSQKERFELRDAVQRKKREFFCVECGQNLNISTSKKDLIYFKHFSKSDDCVLKNATKNEIKSFNEFYVAKESPRHKYLKNEIGSRLKSIKGVSSVHIDDKFIIRNGKKRRPDVYCEYKGFELAFEIQLSDLSLNYLASRHEFYKENGIFLIWILDNFNPEKSTQLVRDIKYLNTYQNFFKLNETKEELELICKYKKSYISEFNRVYDKWTEESIRIDELTFDKVENEVYFKDYEFVRSKLEIEAEKRQVERELKDELERKERAKKEAIDLANRIIDEIRETKKREYADYSSVEEKISLMNDLEIDELNNVLNEKIGSFKKPIISEWLMKARKPSNTYFISFFLRCNAIKLNVNLKYEGKSSFLLLMQNSLVSNDLILKGLLKRGYIITEDDRRVCSSENEKHNLMLFEAGGKLYFDSDIDAIFEDKNRKLFFIVESIRQGKIINSGLTNWLAYANNLVQHYCDYWEYIEKALKYFGMWNKILALDSRKTFKNKVDLLMLDLPRQRMTFKPIFDKLYPELK